MKSDGPGPNPDKLTDKQVSDAGEDGDLTDMLGELRVLLPCAQLLSAFLITVPFNSGFTNIVTSEKGVFLATFMLSILSLVLLSAPAVQHRLIRPLTDRAAFKRLASRQIVIGAVLLGMALTLATQLVLSTVLGDLVGTAFASLTGGSLLFLWWILPKAMRAKGRM
ncbi:MAG: DUF6328 family protein [Pseudomonadota bacterium]